MADLGALPLRHRPARRVIQLLIGLALFALGEAMLVRAGLGVLPWDVLSQGLVAHLGLTLGQWAIIIGVIVLLLWIPLRERPGLGTVLNALLIGLMLDPFLRLIPNVAERGDAAGLAVRAAVLLAGILVNGVGSAVYIGARLGPGPRDGIMTGLVRITGRSVRVIRTAIEVTVVVAGVLLGGNFGVGTVLYALGVGPIIHAVMPHVEVRGAAPAEGAEPESPAEGS